MILYFILKNTFFFDLNKYAFFIGSQIYRRIVFGYHKWIKGYYRSGAVKQLRYMNLNVLGHSSNVELYKSGYGKDDAINYGTCSFYPKIDFMVETFANIYFYIFSQNKQI
jgi:hypothetical protein